MFYIIIYVDFLNLYQYMNFKKFYKLPITFKIFNVIISDFLLTSYILNICFSGYQLDTCTNIVVCLIIYQIGGHVVYSKACDLLSSTK